MTSCQYYDKTAWKGNVCADLDIVEDDDAVIKNLDTPTEMQQRLAMILEINLILQFLIVFFSAMVGVLFCGVETGFIWEKMQESPEWFYIIAIFIVSFIVLNISLHFHGKYLSTYAQFIAYKRGKLNDRVGNHSYTALNYANKLTFAPSRVLNLLRCLPSDYKYFNSLTDKPMIYWDEEKLVEYRYKPVAYARQRSLINTYNWVSILLIWPFLAPSFIEGKASIVFSILVLAINITVFVVLIKTRAKSLDRYPYIEFNRKTGMVTKQSISEGSWVCHFKDINSYTFYERVIPGGTFPYLSILPRYAVGTYRFETHLKGWANYTESSCTELWETLQLFMNVTCPLPISILLESVRAKDPTTQKWDIQNKSVICELNNLLTLSDSEYQARLMQQCYDDDKKLYYCIDSHCAKINRKND
ncbi:hypothetical protein [Pseudoalteromonas rhizosphaerae]|uniref:Uncharacterized protein n=1 Tax=Pseudoalteromonas rhizosphaerae TaxID=2518973 RepID=A0ABW8KYQ3_9GAMM